MNRLNRMIEDQWDAATHIENVIYYRMAVALERAESDYIREKDELDKLMGIAVAVRGFRTWKG